MAIVIGTYPTLQLFNSGRTVSAIVYVVLVLGICILYGIRWFGKNGIDTEKGVWPPVINTCPDYLTFFKKDDGSPTCIDLVGVSKKAGGLVSWSDSYTIENPPSDDKYYFSLSTVSSDIPTRTQELCQRAIEKGLTWEGITNGESCYAPHVSSTTSISGGSGSGGSCTPVV